jgi:hypothetical protein
VATPLDLVVPVQDAEIHMVFSRDGAYVPAVVRKPSGSSPFPCVLCLHGGSGGLGYSYLLEHTRRRGWLLERFVEEGYLVCIAEGRAEREEAYGTDDDAVLDHVDIVEIFHYLQRLPEVDARRIGTFGVSHGGELQMKMIAEMGEGPAAMIPTEPAVIEFLGLKHDASDDEGWMVADSSGARVEERLQFNRAVADEEIDLPGAMKRIDGISPDVNIMVMGRDDDHLQGLFKKLHELLDRCGKRASWATWDHAEHAYQWGPWLTDDGYALDEVTSATADHVIQFLNRHVRDRRV